jgi:hypothetical protein
VLFGAFLLELAARSFLGREYIPKKKNSQQDFSWIPAIFTSELPEIECLFFALKIAPNAQNLHSSR